jgi:hypothetical protein
MPHPRRAKRNTKPACPLFGTDLDSRRMLSRRFLPTGIAAISAAAGLSGCSGTVVSASDASTSTTQALLSVDRSALAGDPTGAARAHASAYFLRLQATADPALAARLVGATNVLPAVGQCEAVGVLSDQAMPLATLGPVDLVDVGEVALEASSVRATFAARAFPDVADLVSGVVYTTRDLVADPLPDHGTYRFRIAGSNTVPAMTLEAHAPGPATNLFVGGFPLGHELLPLNRGDLPIRWQPAPNTDLVYVELASMEDGPLERVRCTFANDGQGVISASALPRAATQSISIHLVRREGVAVPGLDGGWIRFDLATSGTLRFEGTTP